jgi:hypothetical protein
LLSSNAQASGKLSGANFHSFERRLLAQCRRNVVLQHVGGYLGYTGRGANALGKTARDPLRKWRPNAPFLELAVSVALKK